MRHDLRFCQATLKGVPRLAKGEAHVWWFPIGAFRERVEFLNDEEKIRRDRYHFADDARRFAAVRCGLREILGAYLGRDPANVALTEAPGGRPVLKTRDLIFSVSKSGDFALLAVAQDGDLGVDLENQRAINDLDALAATVLSDAEIAALERLDCADRARALLRVWTRKEAVAKALGVGLAIDPRKIEVGVGREPFKPIVDDARAEATAHYAVHDLEPPNGALGAIAGLFSMMSTFSLASSEN